MFIKDYNFRVNINNIAYYGPFRKGRIDNTISYGIKLVYHKPVENSDSQNMYFKTEELRDKKLEELDKLVDLKQL